MDEGKRRMVELTKWRIIESKQSKSEWYVVWGRKKTMGKRVSVNKDKGESTG